jgi:hypothetical protein
MFNKNSKKKRRKLKRRDKHIYKPSYLYNIISFWISYSIERKNVPLEINKIKWKIII